jgi:hypothetical protein
MTTPPLAAAAVLAGLLARRVPNHRQWAIAATLAGLLACNVVRPMLVDWPAVRLGVFVSWYAITAWGVAAVLAPEPPTATLAFVLLASASPSAIMLGTTSELARASFALALAAQALAVVRFLSRGRWPDDAQRVALILAASSLSDVAGPWMLGYASRDWRIGQLPAILTWLAISAWELRCLIRVPNRRG